MTLGGYELVTRLARGGMAEIWLARGSPDGREAVVKTILPHLCDDQAFVELFHAEAALAKALAHEHIVEFYELGQSLGVHFIAMEHVKGRTLRQIQLALRKRHKAVPPWLVLRVVIDVCRALHYAHELQDDDGAPLGVVHRDVTPENIMVTFSGVTKVLDFGVATARDLASPSQMGRLTGKLAYMAPEQVIERGEASVDRRADVYALGVLLYELLTGVQPLRASNDMALLLKVPREIPKPPSTIARWLPTRLNNAIMTALAKDPAYRYQTTAALGRELRYCQALVGSKRSTREVAALLSELFPEAPPPAPELEPTPEALALDDLDHALLEPEELEESLALHHPIAQRRSSVPPPSDASGVLVRAVYDATPPPRPLEEDEDATEELEESDIALITAPPLPPGAGARRDTNDS